MDVTNTSLGRGCPLPREAPCPPRKFRAYSGHCNNVQRPLWGAANTRCVRRAGLRHRLPNLNPDSGLEQLKLETED